MRITMGTYRPFGINKLADGVYTATLFGYPKMISRQDEEGNEILEHEVEVFRSGILPAASLEEANAYMEQHFESMLTDLAAEEAYHLKLKEKEEAEQYLRSTDYRTLKAVRELPEVRAKLEELYPGEIERNRAAAEAVKAV